MTRMTCQHCNVSLKKNARKHTKFCSAACRSAAWRRRDVARQAQTLIAGMNEVRAEAKLPPLLRDPALDSLAQMGATLRGRFTRRYLLEGSGAAPEAPHSPRMLEAGLTHCGVAVVPEGGQFFLALVLAQEDARPQPLPPTAQELTGALR